MVIFLEVVGWEELPVELEVHDHLRPALPDVAQGEVGCVSAVLLRGVAPAHGPLESRVVQAGTYHSMTLKKNYCVKMYHSLKTELLHYLI